MAGVLLTMAMMLGLGGIAEDPGAWPVDACHVDALTCGRKVGRSCTIACFGKEKALCVAGEFCCDADVCGENVCKCVDPTEPEPTPTPTPTPEDVTLEGASNAIASAPPPECRSAVECLSACEADQGLACRVLASMYELGIGVPRDLAKAESFYRRACELGDARGCGKAREYREQHEGEAQKRKDADDANERQREADRRHRECLADCQTVRHECGQDVVRQHSNCVDNCRDEDGDCIARCDMQFEAGESACRDELDGCRTRCD